MVWHHSLSLMNSFNKTEAAVFSCRLCFLRAFPFISLIIICLYIYIYYILFCSVLFFNNYTHVKSTYISRVQQGKSFRDNYASLLQVITAIICPPCSGCFISDKWHNCYVMNVLRLAHVAFCSTYTYIYYKIELSTYSLYTTCFATISV